MRMALETVLADVPARGALLLGNGAAQVRAQQHCRRRRSGAREDDELLRRPGHRDIAVDRSFDPLTEDLGIDEHD